MSNSAAMLGLTLALYLVGAVLLGANLFLRRTGLLVSGRVAAGLGALFHAGAIGLRCAEVHHAPFTTPAESLSLLAWIVALVYLATEALWRLSASGPFALGLGVPTCPDRGWSARHARPRPRLTPCYPKTPSSLHIIATITAIAAFALAFCCAALYLVAHRILKSKHGLAWMRRLPPLLTVETAAFTLVAVGFPLLTLGILSGIVRAVAGGMNTGWQTDPKNPARLRRLAYLRRVPLCPPPRRLARHPHRLCPAHRSRSLPALVLCPHRGPPVRIVLVQVRCF